MQFDFNGFANQSRHLFEKNRSKLIYSLGFDSHSINFAFESGPIMTVLVTISLELTSSLVTHIKHHLLFLLIYHET